MLEQIDSRRISLGLSVRQLALQLGVAPSLLSMVLNGRRRPSKRLSRILQRWLRTPADETSEIHPSHLTRRFIDERSSHLAPSTAQFYVQKLGPFASWCEEKRIDDVRDIRRADVSEFLSRIRKGRSKRNRPLNTGGPSRLRLPIGPRREPRG